MAKVGEVQVDIKVNTEEIIKELKSVQREAKKATQAVRELETIYDTDEGRFYVKWNQDEEDSCTDIQTTKLSDIPTKYLQRELSKRDGVETYVLPPHGGYANLRINTEEYGDTIFIDCGTITVNKY